MSHYRKKVREHAKRHGGEMIFDFGHHDIYEFKSSREVRRFAAWVKDREEVSKVDRGVKNRVGVKFKKRLDS